jgi:hypothetical protein
MHYLFMPGRYVSQQYVCIYTELIFNIYLNISFSFLSLPVSIPLFLPTICTMLLSVALSLEVQ